MTLCQISRDLAKFCKTIEGIDLAATLPEEFFYNSFDLCVIDAVFSIGVKYTGVKNVVARYKEYVEKTYPNLSGKIRTVDESIAIFDSVSSSYLISAIGTAVFSSAFSSS